MPLRRTSSLLACALLLLSTGCHAPGAYDPADTGTISGDVLLGGLRRNRPLIQALGPNGHHVIYLNYEGVRLLPNFDDSANNQSSVVASFGRSVTFPPFNSTWYSKSKTREQVIADITALVVSYFAAFNVDVVTSRPAEPDYVMAVVGGLPQQIGESCGGGGCVMGIAPLDCDVGGGGQIAYNTQGDVEVVFAFSDVAQYVGIGGSYAAGVGIVAATIAQETAHAYGLGHQSLRTDIMYPLTTGAVMGFIDQASTYADAQNCANGRGTQNSHQLLLQILGENQGDQTAPTVSFTAPAPGATVTRNVTLKLDASDDTGVDHVTVTLTGPGDFSQEQSLTAAPYQWNVALSADGAYQATASAFDAAGNHAEATVSFQVSAAAPADAGSGPAPGEVGASCTSNEECDDHLCADSGVRRFCTRGCDPAVAGSCPAGMICAAQGMDGTFCAFPAGRGGSSGCGVTSPRAPRSARDLVVLALIGLVALRLRGFTRRG